MSDIAHTPFLGKEFQPMQGLPLFDWRLPTPPPPSPRLAAAHRIASCTGIPVGVVLVHYERAGLGMEG